MFAINWAERGGFVRTLIVSIFYTVIIMGPVILGLYYGVEKPFTDKLNQDIANSTAKTKAELSMINNSSCQQLHDRLLSTDHFYDSDNEAIARDHYVAQCGVRLP